MSEFSDPQTFWQHLDELRATLIRVLLALALSTILCFTFSSVLIETLYAPLKEALQEISLRPTTIERLQITNRNRNPQAWSLPKGATLVSKSFQNSTTIPPGGVVIYDSPKRDLPLFFLSPLSGFTTSLRVSFWMGLLLFSPYCLWEVVRFLKPALFQHERSWILPLLGISYGAIFTGLFVSWMWMLPMANRFFFQFNERLGTNLWSVSEYLSFTTSLLVASAFIAETAVLLFFLVQVGILSAELLSSYRKVYIVFSLIISAVLTPPDVFSQLLSAVPLILFYEGAILLAKIKSAKQSKAALH